MKYDFNTLLDRRNTNSIKWDFTEEFFGAGDVLPMWVADMDFSAPNEVVEAVKKRAAHGAYGYTGETEAYYEAIIEWMKKRHQWNIRKEWILYSPGVVPALNISIKVFSEPGDKILIQSPVYFPFFSAVANNDRELVTSELILKDGKYEIDFEDLENKLSSGVKIMILCSPHNPVGRVWSREELMKIGELCLKNNVLVISDEIHSDIVFEGYKHTPFAALSEEAARNTIVCMAPSKTFNIAGLEVSTIIISDDRLREKFAGFMAGMGITEPNIFGAVALEAAYGYGEEWLDELLVYLKENADYLFDYIDMKIPGIKAVKSQGTYLVWLDCRGLGMNNEELKEFMVKKAGVALNDGAAFGPGGEGFMRINIGCPRPLLEEGLKRIESAVKSL